MGASDRCPGTPLWTGPAGKQVHNYQLHEDKLRPIADLPGFLGG